MGTGVDVSYPLRSVESVNKQSGSRRDLAKGPTTKTGGQVDVVPTEISSNLRIPSQMIELLGRIH